MAGSGDLEVLQIIRMLRERVSSHNSSPGYGSNMALHMALGFLFLGGGRFTLGTDPLSIAALIISCFPKFPHHSVDNRYHLQAFRHLYVLACQPRLLMPVDVDTGALCRAKIAFRFNKSFCSDSLWFEDFAPVMLPELSQLEEVVIEPDSELDRYWPVRFSEGKNMVVLEALLKSGSGIALKLREGEAPYPALLHSSSDGQEKRLLLPPDKLAAKNTSQKMPLSWVAQSAKLMGIGGEKATYLLNALLGIDISKNDSLRSTLLLDFDSSILQEKAPLLPKEEEESDNIIPPLHEGEGEDATNLVTVVNKSEEDVDARVLQQLFKSVVCDSFAMGKPEGVTSWISVIMGIKKIASVHTHSGLLVWQIKIFHAISNLLFSISKKNSSDSDMEVVEIENCPQSENARQFVSPDQAISLHCRLMKMVDSWSEEVSEDLVNFLKCSDEVSHFSPKAAITLLVKDVPHPSLLLKGVKGKLQIAKELHRRGISPAIIQSFVSPTNSL